MSDINVDLGGGSMASIIIRGFDDRTKKLLALEAKRHGRSMEAEARELIEAGMRARAATIGVALLQAPQIIDGVDDLRIPTRNDVARCVDFE